MHSGMRRFWDTRADEDPFFFVDNRMSYGQPDLEAFWAEGNRDLKRLLGALGASLRPGDDVVEIGCGIGRLTRVLAREAASVRAVDVSERMLTLAQQHNAGFTNIDWLLGDGSTLTGIASSSADACVSHVVFQHIPDPAITLSYVREMGRVLRPGGWAAFQISNDPTVHRRPSMLKRLRSYVSSLRDGRPGGQHDPRWLGSMVELEALRNNAADASMSIERVVGEGSQFCCVLARRD